MSMHDNDSSDDDNAKNIIAVVIPIIHSAILHKTATEALRKLNNSMHLYETKTENQKKKKDIQKLQNDEQKNHDVLLKKKYGIAFSTLHNFFINMNFLQLLYFLHENI